MSKATKWTGDHRRIAWRLSGRIAGEMVVGFIVIDLVFFVLLAVVLAYPVGMRGGAMSFVEFFRQLDSFADTVGRALSQTETWWPFVLLPLAIVGVIELILVVCSAVRLRGSIRAQLEPLRELRMAADAFAGAAAEAEYGLQNGPATPDSRKLRRGAERSAEALRRMAEALRRVDARDMDAHIQAESVSPELRPLLEAIQEMLIRIEAAYAAQAKFVSDASHELRTPIAVIQGYANLLSRWGSGDPETLQESIEAIRSEADAMKQMVNQLLFLARGDSDTLKLDLRRVDLGPILDEVLREELMIDEAQAGADEKHEIEANIPEYGIFVNGDPALIKQLIRILADNSVKYTPPGGGVKLSAFADDTGRAFITVQDEGQGIRAELLPRIFDRFVRADEARSRNTGGSGLGLSIAKQITELHDGTLEVLSVEGVGSRFTVALPLAQ